MAWTVEFSDVARKTLRKIGDDSAARIVRAMDDIAALANPRQRGKALTGDLAGLWRYRVGDWRVIYRIEDEVVTVLVVDIAHRGEVYE